MVIINCPLCNSSNYIAISKKKYPNVEYNIVKCNNCGFYYTNPEPSNEELLEFYNTNYLEKHTNVWHHFEDNLNHEITRLLIKRGVTSNLDLGSGQGRFVSIL